MPPELTTKKRVELPKELLSNGAFWSVFAQWWQTNGGLPEELRVIQRIAEDRRVHPAQMIFKGLRKMTARGDFD